MVNQYRHPVRQYLDELPAGLLDIAGEPAAEAARRELYEEAALIASDWYVLVDLYTSPGMTDEAIRMFLARGLSDVPDDDRFAPEHEELTLTTSRSHSTTSSIGRSRASSPTRRRSQASCRGHRSGVRLEESAARRRPVAGPAGALSSDHAGGCRSGAVLDRAPADAEVRCP